MKTLRSMLALLALLAVAACTQSTAGGTQPGACQPGTGCTGASEGNHGPMGNGGGMGGGMGHGMM